jgi:hypothetical protein
VKYAFVVNRNKTKRVLLNFDVKENVDRIAKKLKKIL